MEDIIGNCERSDKVIMCVFQKEVGDSGTLHWQGYTEFINAVRVKTVQALLNEEKAHCEMCKGSRVKNVVYCTKEKERVDDATGGPWYWPSEQYVDAKCKLKVGKRTDIESLRDSIMEGKSELDCWLEHANSMARYSNMFGRVRVLQRPPVWPNKEVVLLYGPPGSGKTRFVEDKYNGKYWTNPIGTGFKWFDGLDRDEIVCFDDFGGAASHVRVDSMLRLLDRLPVRVGVKGSFRYFNPRVIYITSNMHPRLWWPWVNREVHYAALARRFTGVRIFSVGKPTEDVDVKKFFTDWSDWCDDPNYDDGEPARRVPFRSRR